MNAVAQRLNPIELLVLALAFVTAASVLVPVAIVLPFGGLALGPAVAAAGVSVRRRGSGPLVRAAGSAAVVLGLAILALGVLVALDYATGSGTDVDSG